MAGTAFAPQPVVAEEDPFGNLEAGDNSTVVTARPASAGGQLQGTASVTLVGGVATFAGLAEKTAGTFSFVFTAYGLAPVISDADRRRGGGGNATGGDDPAAEHVSPVSHSPSPSPPRTLMATWIRRTAAT